MNNKERIDKLCKPYEDVLKHLKRVKSAIDSNDNINKNPVLQEQYERLNKNIVKLELKIANFRNNYISSENP